MSQYDKTDSRLKDTAEFFTPLTLVDDIIDKMVESSPELLTDPEKNTLDPTCGNGQIIMGILKRKYASGMTKQQAIESTLGADLMVDNICDLIARIVFWKEYDIDIFDNKGKPIPELDYPGNDDNHSLYWLYEQHKDDNNFRYTRKYILTTDTIHDWVCVRSKKDQWWIMEYFRLGARSINRSYNGGYLNKNYVVADALKYDFSFDGTQPTIFTPDEIATQERLEKRKMVEEIKLQQQDIVESLVCF